jgi:hypothetical protein
MDDRDSNNSLSHGLNNACEGSFAGLGTVESISGQSASHFRPSWSFMHKAASSQEGSPQLSLENESISQHTFNERKESHVRDLEAKLTALKNYTDSLHSDNDRLKQALQRARTENEILRTTQTTGTQELTLMDYIHALKHSEDQEIMFWLKVARGQRPNEHTSGPTGLIASSGPMSPAGPVASPEVSDIYRRFADDSEMSESSI